MADQLFRRIVPWLCMAVAIVTGAICSELLVSNAREKQTYKYRSECSKRSLRLDTHFLYAAKLKAAGLNVHRIASRQLGKLQIFVQCLSL